MRNHAYIAPSMTHPARRVMPNGPVGRKLQHFKCISKVCVPADGAPLGIASAVFELGQQPKVVLISAFTDGSSALACTAIVPRAPELQRPQRPAASARTDLVRSDLAWPLGHGGTGPCGPTPSARPSAANTRARHCFLVSASDPKLWQGVCAVIKLNINMAVAYIYI
jgi:hypothetical protein